MKTDVDGKFLAIFCSRYTFSQVSTTKYHNELEYSSGNSNIKWKLEHQVYFLKKGDFHGMYFPEGLIEYQVETRIFKWKLEYQVETRIFKWKLEYQMESRIFKWNLEYQVETRISSGNWKLEYQVYYINRRCDLC